MNFMAGNLTSQVRNIAEVTTAVAAGDLSKKITVDVKGEILELKNTINTMVDQLRSFAAEVTRVAREVGTEGKLGGQADVQGVAGTWKDLTDSVNLMAVNLTSQVRNIADVGASGIRGCVVRHSNSRTQIDPLSIIVWSRELIVRTEDRSVCGLGSLRLDGRRMKSTQSNKQQETRERMGSSHRSSFHTICTGLPLLVAAIRLWVKRELAASSQS